jgi:hypothetical protein
VAETPSKLEQIGLTPVKAALIGVLAVVLAGVLYFRLAASGDQAASPLAVATSPLPARRPLPASPATASAASVPADDSLQSALAELDTQRWKTPELANVIAYDPFALPPAFPQPPRAVLDPNLAEGSDTSATALNAERLADAVEQMQKELEELQQRGVRVIVKLRDEYVAMVGDRTLHVGDEINGFIVTAIEPDGVRVEKKGLE